MFRPFKQPREGSISCGLGAVYGTHASFAPGSTLTLTLTLAATGTHTPHALGPASSTPNAPRLVSSEGGDPRYWYEYF